MFKTNTLGKLAGMVIGVWRGGRDKVADDRFDTHESPGKGSRLWFNKGTGPMSVMIEGDKKKLLSGTERLCFIYSHNRILIVEHE